MKIFFLAATVTALLISHARAADPESWIEAKRMMTYGTLGVLTGACETALTPNQAAEIKIALQRSSDSQHDVTQEEFTEAMKAIGAAVLENKDQICTLLTRDYITTSLEEAAAGS